MLVLFVCPSCFVLLAAAAPPCSGFGTLRMSAAHISLFGHGTHADSQHERDATSLELELEETSRVNLLLPPFVCSFAPLSLSLSALSPLAARARSRAPP
eukprot:scaffold4672_cov129-Isochrysis_galbana.AAC.4